MVETAPGVPHNRGVRGPEFRRNPPLAKVTSRQLAVACARVCDDKKGADITVLDVRKLTFIADYFVICSATSDRQARALAEGVRVMMKSKGHLPVSNGAPPSDSRWVLQDFTDVVVHVFDREARQFYDLDGMWADAKPVTWKRAPRKRPAAVEPADES